MAEDTLPSLHRAFLGQSIDPNAPWEKDKYIGGPIRTEGEPKCASANWCTTACAVALYKNRDYARGWWNQYFDQAAFRFMGKEPFSRIYSHWMAFPVMFVGYHSHRHNEFELRDRANKWLRAFWTYLCIAGVDHDEISQFDNPGRSFPSIATSFCGARSFERGDDAQRNKHRGSPYHLDSWITGAVLKRALFRSDVPAEWFKDPFAELKVMENAGYNWSGLTLDEKETLIRILRGQIGEREVAAIRAWIGPYKTLPTFRLIRTATGVILYMEKLLGTGTSGATAPIYGCLTTLDGQQQWLAVDNGFRPAGQMASTAVSFGTTTVRDGRVFATRGDGKEFTENTVSLKHSIPLPAGTPILDLRFGPAGLEVLTPSGGTQLPDPDPDPIPLPPPGTWISRQEFENFAFNNYAGRLPENSEARQILNPLFQTLFLIMDATDPRSAEVTLTADSRRKIEATLVNTLEGIRST